MQHAMTEKMRALKSFIVKYTDEHGIAPSYDEMKDALGIASKGGITRLIDALVERGHVTRLPHRARSCRVLKTAEADKIRRELDEGGAESLLSRAYYCKEVREAMPRPLLFEIAEFLNRNL